MKTYPYRALVLSSDITASPYLAIIKRPVIQLSVKGKEVPVLLYEIIRSLLDNTPKEPDKLADVPLPFKTSAMERLRAPTSALVLCSTLLSLSSASRTMFARIDAVQLTQPRKSKGQFVLVAIGLG